MPQAIEAARWAAVEQFQQRILSNTNPFKSAVAEHAIGLVLSLERPTGPYLMRNAYMDARKVVAARERRRRTREIALPQTGHLRSARWEFDGPAAMNGTGSPTERAILWSNAYQKLRHAVAARHRWAADCLDLWREGYDEREAADKLGVSLGSVKKIKRLIRDTAMALLSGGDLA